MALVTDLQQRGVIASQAEFLGDVPKGGLVGNGVTQASATELSGSINTLGTIAAGVNDAFKLKATTLTPQSWIYVRNEHPTDTAQIFPALGGQINTLAINASITIAAGAARIFLKATDMTPLRWVTLP